MSHDTPVRQARREPQEVYDHSITLLDLVTSQVAAQRLGNSADVHRLQLRINAMERLSHIQPVRII